MNNNKKKYMLLFIGCFAILLSIYIIKYMTTNKKIDNIFLCTNGYENQYMVEIVSSDICPPNNKALLPIGQYHLTKGKAEEFVKELVLIIKSSFIKVKTDVRITLAFQYKVIIGPVNRKLELGFFYDEIGRKLDLQYENKDNKEFGVIILNSEGADRIINLLNKVRVPNKN